MAFNKEPRRRRHREGGDNRLLADKSELAGLFRARLESMKCQPLDVRSAQSEASRGQLTRKRRSWPIGFAVSVDTQLLRTNARNAIAHRAATGAWCSWQISMEHIAIATFATSSKTFQISALPRCASCCVFGRGRGKLGVLPFLDRPALPCGFCDAIFLGHCADFLCRRRW